MINCNMCESKNISQQSDTDTYLYKGKEYEVDINYSICDDCKEEFITSEQTQKNEKNIRAAKKSLDNLLSSEEVFDIRKQFGFTQEAAADIFGGGANAFSKYERNEVCQSVAMDKLIKVAFAIPEALDYLVGLSKKVDHYNVVVENKEVFTFLFTSQKPLNSEEEFNTYNSSLDGLFYASNSDNQTFYSDDTRAVSV